MSQRCAADPGQLLTTSHTACKRCAARYSCIFPAVAMSRTWVLTSHAAQGMLVCCKVRCMCGGGWVQRGDLQEATEHEKCIGRIRVMLSCEQNSPFTKCAGKAAEGTPGNSDPRDAQAGAEPFALRPQQAAAAVACGVAFCERQPAHS